MSAPDADGDALELPPLPDKPLPELPFCETVNGQPTAFYVAGVYFRAESPSSRPEDRDLVRWFAAGWSVLQRLEALCKCREWPVGWRQVDWLVREYATELGYDLLAGWNLPFVALVTWHESRLRAMTLTDRPTNITLNQTLVLPTVAAPRAEPGPTFPEWLAASKAEINRLLWPGGYPHNTRKLDEARASGILEYRDAERPIGHRKYEFHFRDPSQHARIAQELSGLS